MKRFLFLVLVFLLSSLTFPAAAQTTNLLHDPGFDGEQYVLVSKDPVDGTTFSVPQGWGGGVAREPHHETWMNIQPTGFPHTGGFRWAGPRSLHVARGFATFTAWVYQQVSVQPNSEVQGGAHAFIESGITSVVWVGIDPNGGTNPFEPSVVWSSWHGGLYQWNVPTVNTRANGGTVTIFLYASQSIPNNPNGVYWDDAFLNGIPGSGVIDPGTGPDNGGGGQFVVPTASVNIRSGAGTTFPRIGAGRPGDSFALKGEVGNWYEIDFNGRSGFISKDFATLGGSGGDGGANIPVVDSLNFTANYALRMRAAPSTDSAELAYIPYTTVIQAIGRTPDNIWIQVNYAGQTGWVVARYGALSGDIRSLPVR